MDETFAMVGNVVGFIIAMVLVVLNVRFSKSLLGSFFKSYCRWMIAGAVVFGAGFLTEFGWVTGLGSENGWETVHHILLIIAGAIFVLTSLALPKAISRYMSSRQNGN